MNTQTQQRITSIVEGMLREPTEYTVEQIKARVKLMTGGFTVEDYVINNINERVEAERAREASQGANGYSEEDHNMLVMSELIKQRPSLGVQGVMDLMAAKGIRVTPQDVQNAETLMYKRGQGVGGVNLSQDTQMDIAEEACELLGALDAHLAAQVAQREQAEQQQFLQGAQALGMDEAQYWDAQLVEAGRMSVQQFQHQHGMNPDGSALTEVQQAALM